MKRLLLGMTLGLLPLSVGAATVSNTYFVDREISLADGSLGSIFSVSPRFNIIDVDEFDANFGDTH